MRYKLIFILLFILMNCASLYAQNPFMARGESENENLTENITKSEEDVKNKSQVSKRKPNPLKGMFVRFMRQVSSWQLKMRNKMGNLFRSVKKGDTGMAFWILILISFAYGMVHALGPGHGKLMMSAYFLSYKAKAKDGFLAGGLVAFLHSMSALSIVLVLYLIVKASLLRSFENANILLQKISALFIVAIGLFMISHTIYETFISKNNDNLKDKEKTVDKRSIFAVALSIGIVPCPGAMIILFFSLNMQILWAGVLAVFAMSFGMALTLSLIAIFTILSKDSALMLVNKKEGLKEKVLFSLRLLAYILIIMLGIILFLSLL